MDDLGRRVALARPASRVVSLVPSLTEGVFALGAGDRLVGVTKFCVYPEEAMAVPAVGGTKRPDIGTVVELRPDLVLLSADENRREDAEALEEAGLATFATEPRRLPDVSSVLRRIGRLLGVDATGQRVADRVATAVAAAEAAAPCGRRRPRVLTLVWKKPFVTAGPRTYLADLVRRAGGEPLHPGGDLSDWPRIAAEEALRAAPDVVLLPDEPYAFTEADAEGWRGREGLPEGATVRVVDGQLVTWAGPRVGEGVRLVAGILAEWAASATPVRPAPVPAPRGRSSSGPSRRRRS
ncbi:MAG: helical backbone metal receptor [Planctomycetales bacterium]|nr:helical backbone metal receptor [Planctomycetales bacterium]